MDWLKAPLGGGDAQPEYAPGQAPEDYGGDERGQVNTQKQRRKARQEKGVDRRASISADLIRAIRTGDGVTKPYDPGFLKEVSTHPVAQAYIDTLAQDAATASWSIKQRDERMNVPDTMLAQAERTIEGLHPEKSFRDLKEMAARNTLTLGDGAWVLHFYEGSGKLAEAIPVDSERLFKVIDENGITTGYLEVSRMERKISNRYDLNEIVWFEWSSRPGHVYGHGPVEKGLDTLEVLDELSEKELKDLTEGMPPGIVSVKEDEDTPLAVDAYENVKENWQLEQGQRHRAIVSMGDWQFTPLTPGYQELQFLERNKFWIHVMGAVFKCNAPYAGFDFQEGNKAQNEAQAEAYAQRGFRVLLRQMEEAINRQLVWPHISEDLQFEFEMEKTAQEREQHAQYLSDLADAAGKWAKMGRSVSLRNGQLDIEDGEITAPPDDSGGMGLPAPSGGGDQGSGQPQQPAQAPGQEGQGGQQQARASTEKAADVRFGNVGGDPFDDQEALEQFLHALNAKADAVYIGDDLWPCEDYAMHDRPVEAYGISMDDALAVWALFEPHALALGGPVEKGQYTREMYETADDALLSAHKSQIWPASLDDIEKSAWSGDQSVPDYVKGHIKEAIASGRAVFPDIKSVPESARKRLESLLEDNLTQPQGWSLKSIVDDMADVWPGVSRDKLEVVARTETASVLNEAREIGYESMPGGGEDRFYWQGPSDSRTTDACEALKAATNPQHGGSPVGMNELVQQEEKVHDEYFKRLTFRKHCIHPNERHTFVRDFSASLGGGS